MPLSTGWEGEAADQDLASQDTNVEHGWAAPRDYGRPRTKFVVRVHARGVIPTTRGDNVNALKPAMLVLSLAVCACGSESSKDDNDKNNVAPNGTTNGTTNGATNGEPNAVTNNVNDDPNGSTNNNTVINADINTQTNLSTNGALTGRGLFATADFATGQSDWSDLDLATLEGTATAFGSGDVAVERGTAWAYVLDPQQLSGAGTFHGRFVGPGGDRRVRCRRQPTRRRRRERESLRQSLQRWRSCCRDPPATLDGTFRESTWLTTTRSTKTPNRPR